MTEEEARRIRSAFCNGFEFPFGGGLAENCDMEEVERHAQLLEDAINKQIPKAPIDVCDSSYNAVLSCPNCKQPIVNVWNKSAYMPAHCHCCGQALKWSAKT